MHTRIPVLSAFFLPLILNAFPLVVAAETEEAPSHPPPVASYSFGTIAVVGPTRLRADEVFELWTPVWYETLAKVRNGKMSAREGDAKLDAEWRRVIMSLIKDEVFYQEADREHNSMLNNIIEQTARQSGRLRAEVVNEVRNVVQKDIEKYFSQFSREMIKESGGITKLNKVLQGRGVTFQDWQNRLRKKAFTQSYLYFILKPLAPNVGPKQIQDYYARHDDEFTLPGRVRFRHIFFSNALHGADEARERAIEAWERIIDEEMTFEQAAAEYSDDAASKTRGGLESGDPASDPEREAWLADVRKALADETPGELAPILESPFGCHLASLIDIGPIRKMPFNEVKRDIEQKLNDEVMEAARDRYFAAIQKGTDIQVLMRRFPENLSCSAMTGLDSRNATVYRIGGSSPPDIQTRERRPR